MAGPDSTCTQCRERPWFFEYEGGHRLCVDCNLKVQQAEQVRISTLAQAADQQARMINYLTGQMETAVGLPGLYPRIEVPNPVVHTGDVALNNIQIDNSVVGVVNTGNIAQLDVSLSAIRTAGRPDLAEALTKFTEAALAPDTPIDDDERNRIVEELAFLSEEAQRPPEQRKAGITGMLIDRLRTTASTVTTLSVAWSHLEPILRAVLGLG